MISRHQLAIEELKIITQGVMPGGDEMGVIRNDNPTTPQDLPNTGMIERVSGHTGVDLATMSTTCTAVERRCKRIVRTVAAVAANQDQTGEVRSETHSSQSPLGDTCQFLNIVTIEMWLCFCMLMTFRAWLQQICKIGDSK